MSSTSPSCKIEVRANKLGGIGPLSWYHLHIVFTDSSGNQTGLRGGPSGHGPGGGSGLATELSGGSSDSSSAGTSDALTSGCSGSGSNPASSSDSSAGNPNGPFGTIVTQVSPYDPSFIDYEPTAPSVVIEEGPAVCAKLSQMESELKNLQDANTRYSPFGPNSNSVVSSVLRRIGLKPQIPDGVWAPGAGTHL